MAQTGFPNGGILPDDNVDLKYSNLISSEYEIKQIANTMSKSAFTNDISESKQIATATQIEGLVTAALTLAQYYWQQVTYTGEDGYGSQNNPVSPQFSTETKKEFVSRLGNNPDSKSLNEAYNNAQNGPRNLSGVQNVYYNLGAGENSFKWDANGNLNITDKYKFTGINDFGAAPPEKDKQDFKETGDIRKVMAYIPPAIAGAVTGIFIFGPLALNKGNGIIDRILYNILGPDRDPVEPFDYDFVRSKNGGTLTSFGSLEPMHIKTTFTPQEIYDNNPQLFWGAVKQGLIPLTALPNFNNAIEVGSGPDPFGFLPNYAPKIGDIGTNMNNWTFGGGGNYPQPFTSFSQRIINANYSLGPYAMLDYKNPTTNISERISGRIAILSVLFNGAPSEFGFVKQNWYGADSNGVGYGNNLLKWQWWEQCIKTKHDVKYGHFPGYPEVTLQVATACYAAGDANNFAPDLPIQEDYTLLLGTVLAAAALGVIL